MNNILSICQFFWGLWLVYWSKKIKAMIVVVMLLSFISGLNWGKFLYEENLTYEQKEILKKHQIKKILYKGKF